MADSRSAAVRTSWVDQAARLATLADRAAKPSSPTTQTPRKVGARSRRLAVVPRGMTVQSWAEAEAIGAIASRIVSVSPAARCMGSLPLGRMNIIFGL